MASKYTYEFNVNDNVIATFGSNRYEGRILKRHGGRYQIEYKERGKWFTEWFGQSTVTARPEDEPTPTPTANTETVSAKAVKLSAAQDDGMRKIAKAHTRVGGEQWIDPYIIDVRQATAEALGKKGLVETSYTGVVGYKQFVRVRFTELGKQYAIAHGWLTAPANSEPQADVFGDDEPIIMSDADKEDLRQRFDAMRAERKATKNTQDVPASNEISKQDAQDSGKTVVDSFDSATKLNASALYTLLNEAEETVDAEIEMISEQPTAIDGIFYQIEDGWITANVHDMADNLKIRFIGIDEDKHQHAMLLQSDVDVAEKYRTEMEAMFSEE